MDPAWVTACIAGVGIAGQLAIGLKTSGARDEQLRAHEGRLGTVEVQVSKHSVKIAKCEALLSGQLNGSTE